MFTTRCLILLEFVGACWMATGCDSGYRYNPINPVGRPVDIIRQSRGAIVFEMKGYQVLTGSKFCPGVLKVINNSNQKVVVRRGELHTKGMKLKACLSGVEEEDEHPGIPPGQSVTVQPTWELGGDASATLDPDLVYVWHVTIDGQEDEIRFQFRRGK